LCPAAAASALSVMNEPGRVSRNDEFEALKVGAGTKRRIEPWRRP